MRKAYLAGNGLGALILALGVLGGCASTQGSRSEWLAKIPAGCDVRRVEFVQKGGARLLLLSVGGLEPAVATRWASGMREALLGSIAEKRQSRRWRKMLPKAMQMSVLGCAAASHDQAFWIGQLSGADAVLWGTLRERPKTDRTDAAEGPDSVDFHLTPVRPVARTSPFDRLVDFPPVIWWASWKDGADEGPAPRTEGGRSMVAEPARPALAMNGGGIGPGPFEPRGQPVHCYVGNEVHEAIGRFYGALHPLDKVFVNTSPISKILREAKLPRPRGTPKKVFTARPDIVNLTRRHIYEIKPLGQSDAALTQMVRYQKYLGRVGLHMTPGPVGEPGTAGVLPAPKGHVFFYGAVPGVILYYCMEGRYEEVEQTATEPRALAEAAAAARRGSSRRTITGAPPGCVLCRSMVEAERIRCPRGGPHGADRHVARRLPYPVRGLAVRVLAAQCATCPLKGDVLMQVPALIYGDYPEVERRARRMVTKMKRGATLEEAIGADHLIDTTEHDGLFNLNSAGRSLANKPYFHIICALSEIGGGIWEGRLPETLEETAFHACLQTAWGVLLLLPHSLSARWVDPEHRWLPFLQAAARFWPLFEAEGERYTYGSEFYKTTLAYMPTTVDYVLGNAGIFIFKGQPEPMRFPGPLRPPDWPALVEAYAERRKLELH